MRNIDRDPEGERRSQIELLKIDLDKEGWIEEKMKMGSKESRYKEMGAIEIEVEAFNTELARFMYDSNFLNEQMYEVARAELQGKRRDLIGKIRKYTSS
ncbi:hypothetical protein HZB93_01265 [Candidatus Falkowbacteria bacterium]|nr:hypothetical protein [Candidatus Falkowbacteria bacterium]